MPWPVIGGLIAFEMSRVKSRIHHNLKEIFRAQNVKNATGLPSAILISSTTTAHVQKNPDQTALRDKKFIGLQSVHTNGKLTGK